MQRMDTKKKKKRKKSNSTKKEKDKAMIYTLSILIAWTAKEQTTTDRTNPGK